MLTLAPLHKRYTIKRVVVSTYQSITGTGVKAVQQMENERNGISGEMAYAYPIDKNCIPQCDSFLENGYTKEEMKLTNETKKILDNAIRVTATAVRVPVVGGHSEAVNIEFATDFELQEVRKILHETPGITLKDDPTTNNYPMPKYAEGKDDVFVGRIRRDESQDNTLNLWIVADNLRKGAATNAVQIAKLLIERGIL
jgi:aspartate-semialdehyde dehydrogenase